VSNANIKPDNFPAFRWIEHKMAKKDYAFQDRGRYPEQYMSKRELWVYYEGVAIAKEMENQSIPDGGKTAQEY
jgi:hypothetical protein